jgi:hypothetical protein
MRKKRSHGLPFDQNITASPKGVKPRGVPIMGRAAHRGRTVERGDSRLGISRLGISRLGISRRQGGIRSSYAIATTSSSWPADVTTSPTLLPISDLATGEAKEIEPTFGSASSSPTMR